MKELLKIMEKPPAYLLLLFNVGCLVKSDDFMSGQLNSYNQMKDN